MYDQGFSLKPIPAGIPSRQLEGCNAYSFKKPIITPEGNICFCDYLTYDPTFHYGNVSSGINAKNKLQILKEMHNENDCKSCRYLFTCGGP